MDKDTELETKSKYQNKRLIYFFVNVKYQLMFTKFNLTLFLNLLNCYSINI
ncbi:hypothetical protein SAMN05444387_2949 [Flavobacterium pectinovorum]|jgi:hypothetical protein|uniref:Uncharacterized protein n=1 Tax=Flavobacterium pectinovorum TaxID=29533 RepID=A0ABY1J546_9FLAO|nr:hypothetical protein SAMN05444387_2949 [Flavobacterium pectinovorum]